MKKTLIYTLCIFCLFGHNAKAQVSSTITKGSTQRISSSQQRRNHNFTDFGQEYTDFKNKLQKEYNFDYSVDISYMPQRGAPNGNKTSYQTIIYPTASWQIFNNDYGTGTLNFAYNIVRYAGINGNSLGSNIGIATSLNDYTNPSNSFDELLYTHQFKGNLEWLSLSLGQFPLYNFDGSQYNSNQQENFINYALSQNATSTYPTAGFGIYSTISPTQDISFSFGAQDATNVDGISIHPRLNKHKYTTFASLTYNPTINLGDSYYSLLVYNQPSVKEQPQSTTGWSLNWSQNIGEKWNVFARANGVNKDVAYASFSYVLGTVYNNPLNRNPLDQIGFATTLNKINKSALEDNNAHDYETVLETYWAWGISKWMTITPDVQFYIKPALNTKSDTATVFSLRATLFL